MINNKMADNYYLKAKEIYYRNFFVLTQLLSLHIENKDDSKNENNNNELTLDEITSGLHTSVTLFLKSLICKKNYLLLISNEHERPDDYIIANFHKMQIVDGKTLYKLFTNNCLDMININNDYNMDFNTIYNDGMEIRNSHYHSNTYNKDYNFNKILKYFLAINQIFLNHSFRRQIYKDIIRMLPYQIFKEKNIGNLKSNEEIIQSYENNEFNTYVMYDSARYLYFEIITNIFLTIGEIKIREKVFDIKNHNKRLNQYYCPNCTVYNINHLSLSEFGHDFDLLEKKINLNKNVKSLISIDQSKSLFKCICCNDMYILKNKVSICNHQKDYYHVNAVRKKPEMHYMIDNVCLECGRENFGEVKFRKRNIYIVRNHIDKTENFKLDTNLFWDNRQIYVITKRRSKYLRRKRNKLIYRGKL